MSTSYVIEVRLEEACFSDTTVLYGPFRSRERALYIAERIGEGAGLNRNTWGQWTGTDGDVAFAFIKVRPVLSPHDWRDAVHSVRQWFNRPHLGVG